METNQPPQLDLDLHNYGIFFTSLVLVFNGICLTLSLLYGQYDFAVFLLILFFMAFGLRLWSRFSVRHLKYDVHLDKYKVFPGENVQFNVTIENKKLLPVLIKIRLNLHQTLVSGDQEVLIKKDSNILWFQKMSLSHELVPQKRGVYKTGSPRLITGDFFGFFPRETRERQTVEILVFPRLVPLKPFPVISRIMFGKPALSSPVNDPIYILGTRDYQIANPSRNIHWKASARLSKLQEKIFESAEQEKMIVILEADQFVGADAENAFEQSIRVLASLAIELDRQHYAVGFLTNCRFAGFSPNQLKPARGSAHISSLLETVAKIRFSYANRMDELLSKKSVIPTGATCIYFSCRPLIATNPLIQQKIPVINIVSQLVEEDGGDLRINHSGPTVLLGDISEEGRNEI